LASEKPILLGVGGEAKKLFIEVGNTGLYFEPENVDFKKKRKRIFVKFDLTCFLVRLKVLIFRC
jgi:hypothetical protein